jgi:hypothetical protein
MKICENTLTILKNFSGINNSILIKQGNLIQTISHPEKFMVAQAEVKEQFDKDFTIYELSRFLGAISLFEEKEVSLEDKFAIIGNAKHNIRYFYAAQNTIVSAPYKEIKFDDKDVIAEFELDFTPVIKTTAVLQLPFITIMCDGENLIVKGENIFNKSSDVYEQKIKEQENKFSVSIKTDYMRIIPLKYSVKVNKNSLVNFYNEERKLNYWITSEAK